MEVRLSFAESSTVLKVAISLQSAAPSNPSPSYSVCHLLCALSSDKGDLKDASQTLYVPLIKIFFSTTNSDDGRPACECQALMKTNSTLWATARAGAFCMEKGARGLIHNSEASQRYERGEDASVCITPALPPRCITLPVGSFFESLIRSLSVALWLWLISASDKSLYSSPRLLCPVTQPQKWLSLRLKSLKECWLK